MPRVGRKRKKTRTEKHDSVSEKDLASTPRCFVLKRGAVGNHTKELVQDFRQVMMPNCAKNLRESKLNRMEDFIAVAGALHVSHLITFTVTKLATYMKLAKLPQGPTLTFKVNSFSLVHDVKASQKRPRTGSRDYTTAPLQVLNGFGSAKDTDKAASTELTAEMLRGLFPAVDVPTFNQAECRRTALFQYDKETDSVNFRHYTVARKGTGVHQGIAKLLRVARLPKMSGQGDISDFILGTAGSDSEAETTEGPGGNKMAVRLTETGPRLNLQLIKAEAGVNAGSVIYHRYQTRTPSQQEVLEQKAAARKKLKERDTKLIREQQRRKGTLKKVRQDKEKRIEANRATTERLDPGSDSGDDGAAKAKGGKKAGGGQGGGGGQGADRPAKGAQEAAPGEKRKRFHPFGWGAKDAKKANKGDGATVEIRSGGGKAKGGGKGGGGKGGGKSAGKGGGMQKALDRFHSRK